MLPRDVVQRTGEPSRWLAGESGTELVRAAVIDAWSMTSPGPAGAWSCKALATGPLAPLVEDAALLAIGRAHLKCDAVLATRSRHCPRAKQYVTDVDGARARLTEDDAVPGDALFCAPELGYVLAQVAQTPTFDEAAWRERCFRRDAENGSAASPEPASAAGDGDEMPPRR